MKLTLKESKYIVAVHDNGSMISASKMLGKSAPCVSYNIKYIEDRLGSVIFNRRELDNRKVTTTEIGDKIVKQARDNIIAAKKLIDIEDNKTEDDWWGDE